MAIQSECRKVSEKSHMQENFSPKSSKTDIIRLERVRKERRMKLYKPPEPKKKVTERIDDKLAAHTHDFSHELVAFSQFYSPHMT